MNAKNTFDEIMKWLGRGAAVMVIYLANEIRLDVKDMSRIFQELKTDLVITKMKVDRNESDIDKLQDK